jgi:hypothetical protein
VAIGDIKSNERGTGARFNDGKPALELLGVRYYREMMQSILGRDEPDPHLMTFLDDLIRFQEGDTDAVHSMVTAFASLYRDAAQVFAYGRDKYAAWNWAKGMPWSVPIGCILRHFDAIVLGEELVDPESGLPHFGHILCNIIMLRHFVEYYPEGDDRPDKALFTPFKYEFYEGAIDALVKEVLSGKEEEEEEFDNEYDEYMAVRRGETK